MCDCDKRLQRIQEQICRYCFNRKRCTFRSDSKHMCGHREKLSAAIVEVLK